MIDGNRIPRTGSALEISEKHRNVGTSVEFFVPCDKLNLGKWSKMFERMSWVGLDEIRRESETEESDDELQEDDNPDPAEIW